MRIDTGTQELSASIVFRFLIAKNFMTARLRGAGTMKNLKFGNDSHQYREIVCSGAPAGPAFDGASGAHTHLTNSRLKDPEILESRYPVVLEEFWIRRGSGGKGRHDAGDATLRTIRFFETMECAVLSGQRRVKPFGMLGGKPGEVGRNLVRRSGKVVDLTECDSAILYAVDAFTIITPTGGGFGPVRG